MKRYKRLFSLNELALSWKAWYNPITNESKIFSDKQDHRDYFPDDIKAQTQGWIRIYKTPIEINIETFKLLVPREARKLQKFLINQLGNLFYQLKINQGYIIKEHYKTTKRYKRLFPLDEFAISDFSNYVSPKTDHFRKERNREKGTEVKLATLLDFDFEKDRALFGTEPTFEFDVDTYEKGGKSPAGGTFYIIEIELVDLKKWVEEDEWKTLTLTKFREIMDVIDLKIHCSCPAFLWQGHRYQLTNLDSAIYPISIADPIWNPRHKNKGGLCKHSLGIIRMLKFSASWILKEIRKKAKEKGLMD